MFTMQRTLSLGYLRQRWIRALLVVLVIALGVATVVSTRILNQNLNSAAQSSINPFSGLFDLVIANGQSGVPSNLAKQLNPANAESASSPLAAIESLHPFVFGRLAVPRLDNRSVMVIGLDPDSTKGSIQALQDIRSDLKIDWLASEQRVAFELGRAWFMGSEKTPVLISADLAADLGLKPGQPDKYDASAATIQLRMANIEQSALVIGLVNSTKKESLPERDVVFMQAAPAARFIYSKRPDYVTQIYVKLKPGADKKTIQAALEQRVDLGIKVQTVRETLEKTQDITAGLELGFNIGSVGALVIGLFLVYNALSVSVAERRHDIGILRSVGATRSQIAQLFLSEALLLGFLGSLLGLPIGYGLAWLAMGPITRVISDSFLLMNPSPLVLDWATMGLALAAGVTTTVLAALVPAMQAAREEPANVVRRTPTSVTFLVRLFQIGTSLLLIAVGMACVAWRDQLPLRFGTFAGIVFILVAGLLATPLLAVIVGRFLQPFFRLFLGLEGRLAADNLARSSGRTGLVIAALAATGALMVQTAGFIRSSEEAILAHVEQSIAADLFVTAGGTLNHPGFLMPMDESLRQELLALPGVDAVLAIRLQALPYRDRLALMLALDARAFEKAETAHPLARSLTGHFPRLREAGTCLVSENFAALYKVKVGDTITVPGLKGPINLEVLGSIVDYTWNRGTILVDRDWYCKEYPDRQVDIFDVYLKQSAGEPVTESQRQAVRDELTKRFHQRDAVHAMTRGELREAVTKNLRGVYSLAYAQQAVVGVVALLGVIMALLISVIQRRREFGLMRAVGAAQGQILRSVLAEAVLMGMVGAILGLLIGIVLEWYVIAIVLLDEAGFIFPMKIPWLEAGAVMGLSVLMATLVGLWPAWQATQIRIAEAIAYE